MDEQIQPRQEQPVTPESEFQPHPPQSNKKIWIYVLIGLIIVGGAFGFYVWQKGRLLPTLPTPTVSPTPDPTTDWQTYRNDKYGFEFKYPNDWQVRDLTSGAKHDDNIVRFFGAGSISQPEDSVFNLIIYKNPLDIEISRQENIISSNPNQELVATEDINMFGLNGKKITAKNKSSGILYSTYYFSKNNLTYSLNDLLTFRFIEPTFCIQVITPARNPETGEVRDFPTPCDVPEGWEMI